MDSKGVRLSSVGSGFPLSPPWPALSSQGTMHFQATPALQSFPDNLKQSHWCLAFIFFSFLWILFQCDSMKTLECSNLYCRNNYDFQKNELFFTYSIDYCQSCCWTPCAFKEGCSIVCSEYVRFCGVCVQVCCGLWLTLILIEPIDFYLLFLRCVGLGM